MRQTHKNLTSLLALALLLLLSGSAKAQTKSATTTPTANLHISSFQLTYNANTWHWELKVGIWNSGPGPSSSAPCSLSMRHWTPSTTIGGKTIYFTPVNPTIKAVAAVPAYTMGLVTVTFDMGTTKPTGYGDFTVDYYNVVPETNESDNSFTYYF